MKVKKIIDKAANISTIPSFHQVVKKAEIANMSVDSVESNPYHPTYEDNKEELKYLIDSRIVPLQIDLTEKEPDWFVLGCICYNVLGPTEGREYYHKLSQFYVSYNVAETDRKFDHIIEGGGYKYDIGTLIFNMKRQNFCFMAFSKIDHAIEYLKGKYQFRYNTATNRTEVAEKDSKEWSMINDQTIATLLVELEQQGYPMGRQKFGILLMSNQLSAKYDPYKTYLENLPQWDGQDYIGQLADTVKCTDQEYWNFCFKKWFVAMVASISKSEIVNQTVLILCGGQGVGKTTWFINLLPAELEKYKSCGYIHPHDKDDLITLSECMLYIMDEVGNLCSDDVESLKEIITKPYIHIRRPYGMFHEHLPHRCSLCGTSNNTSILRDQTGNRRFLCHKALEFDNYHHIDLDKVYAQAKALIEEGFQYWFDTDEQTIVDIHNEDFRHTSPEEELLTTYFEQASYGSEGAILIQSTEILRELKEKSKLFTLSPEKLGKTISSLGFESKKTCGTKYWVVKKKMPQPPSTLATE